MVAVGDSGRGALAVVRDTAYAANQDQKAYALHEVILESTTDEDLAAILDAEAANVITAEQRKVFEEYKADAREAIRKIRSRRLPPENFPTWEGKYVPKVLDNSDLCKKILLQLDPEDLHRARAVSKQWLEVIDGGKLEEKRSWLEPERIKKAWLVNRKLKTIRVLHVASINTLGPFSISQDREIGVRCPMLPHHSIFKGARNRHSLTAVWPQLFKEPGPELFEWYLNVSPANEEDYSTILGNPLTKPAGKIATIEWYLKVISNRDNSMSTEVVESVIRPSQQYYLTFADIVEDFEKHRAEYELRGFDIEAIMNDKPDVEQGTCICFEEFFSILPGVEDSIEKQGTCHAPVDHEWVEWREDWVGEEVPRGTVIRSGWREALGIKNEYASSDGSEDCEVKQEPED
ncbi:hypothetical protein LTR36_004807 [Oleoguttula mirabilis]|uniref:F-box domain-containing protein n=1 Tax=Oleoguttula mirabilis TaxID=1507867 RepID=A0AAV9JG33_9PEZI|nr:hypothetical protein LTR36_004807 [Oleoguttula mirabilis]